MFRSRMVRLALLGVAMSAAIGAVVALNRWRSSWGVDPADEDRILPGDDLVPAPSQTETRGIEINAPTAAVWPWLVQMGYGRAGWYSYDQLDMKGRSADAVIPALQSLKVGDIMPTFPGGGFEVRVVEPGHALAVYTDTAITAAQAAAFAEHPVAVPVGLQASGSFMRTTPPDFAASWAFFLEPLPGDRTRPDRTGPGLVWRRNGPVGRHRPGARLRGLPHDTTSDAGHPRPRRARRSSRGDGGDHGQPRPKLSPTTMATGRSMRRSWSRRPRRPDAGGGP